MINVKKNGKKRENWQVGLRESRKKLTRSCGDREDVREVLKILCDPCVLCGLKFGGLRPRPGMVIGCVVLLCNVRFAHTHGLTPVARLSVIPLAVLAPLPPSISLSPIYCKLFTIHFFSVGASVQVSRTRNFISRVSPASRKK